MAIHTPPEHTLRSYILAVFACLLITIAAHFLMPLLDIANIVMLFLLTVFLVALNLGRNPAIMAAFLSVILFDIVCVPPRWSLAVHDVQYLLMFAVMLAVGLITAQLTAGVKQQAQIAEQGRQQNHYLFQLARELTGTMSVSQVHVALKQYLQKAGYDCELYLLNDKEQLQAFDSHDLPAHFATMVIHGGAIISVEDLLSSGKAALLIPLKAPMRIRGALAVGEVDCPNASDEHLPSSERDLLMTVASLVAIAIERLHYVDVANESLLNITSERLRSSILSALSHDLRTPLTALVGLAETLTLTPENLSQTSRTSAIAIHEQAWAMSNVLNNLLDMARLHTGNIKLNIDWQLFEDVISSSLHLLKNALHDYSIKVNIEPNFPLVEFDAVLLERVVCNLIENAAKYSPKHSLITVDTFLKDQWACITVSDQGCGFLTNSIDDTPNLFDMFVRGDVESTTPGVGLGLTICRAIIDAHHGEILAENNPEGGARVTIKLLRGNPPQIPQEVDEGFSKESVSD